MDENREIYFVKSDQKMFALLLSHENWNITGKPRSLDLARKQKEAREGGGANNLEDPRRIATTRMDSAGLGRAPSSLVDLRVFDDNLTSTTLDLSSTSTMNLGLGIACSLAPRPSVIASTFSDNESFHCHSQRSNEDSGSSGFRRLDPCLELDQDPAWRENLGGGCWLSQEVSSCAGRPGHQGARQVGGGGR